MFNKIFSLLLLLVLFLGGCKRTEQQDDQTTDSDIVELNPVQMRQIKTAIAKVEEERSLLIMPGRVTFNKDLFSQIFPFVGGNVLKVFVSMGDHISKGQPLAILRGGDMSNAQSQYEQDKAQVRLAKRSLDIANELYKTKVYAQKDVLQAEVAYSTAVDQLTKDKVYLQSYGVTDTTMKGEFEIKSPIEGFVVSKSVTEGMNVRPDNTNALFTISSIKTVWLVASIYENDVAQIQVGDSANITPVAYPDTVFKGTITSIAPAMDSSAGTLQARIVINNPNGLLKAGMFATVKIEIDKHKRALAIPKEALVFYDNNWYVMVEKGKNRFLRTLVNAETDNGDMTYIKKGLHIGDTVVTKGSIYVYGQ